MNLSAKGPRAVVCVGLLILLSLGGCRDYYGTGLERAVSSFEDRSSDVVTGDTLSVEDESTTGGAAAFRIDRVLEKRRMVSSAPWHVEGGSWVVIEAHLADDPLARFAFGYRLSSTKENKRSTEEAFLACPSVDAGNRFLNVMVEKLGGALPPLGASNVNGSMLFNAWIKGDDYQRLGPGKYQQGEGEWQSIRLFLQHAGQAGDLSMGLNLSTKEGEFVEFDKRGREHVSLLLAAALRGAPFPHGGAISEPVPREILSSDVRQFPVLKDWRVLWPRKDAKPHHCIQGASDPSCRVTLGDWGFCPGGKHAFFTEKQSDGRSEIRRIAMSNPGFSTLVGRTRGTLWKMVCLDENGQNFLIIDVQTEHIKNGVLTSSHPRHVWTLDTQSNAMVRWRGPWAGHLPWAERRFLSPGGDYLLLQAVHRVAKRPERTHVWYALHLTSRSAIRLNLPSSLHQFRGWDGFDTSLQAMFVTGGVLDETRVPYLVRPGTGSAERVARLPVPLMQDDSLSPNGRWQYRLKALGVEILDRSSGQARMFRIPKKDRIAFRSGCCSWMGSDHLLLTSPTLGILSVDSLRYATLPDAESIPHIIETDDESGWMFILAGQELSLARIVLPLGTDD